MPVVVGAVAAWPRHRSRACCGQKGREISAPASTITAARPPTPKAATTPTPRRRIRGRREGFACIAHGRLSLYRGFGQSVDLVEHGLAGRPLGGHDRLERQGPPPLPSGPRLCLDGGDT